MTFKFALSLLLTLATAVKAQESSPSLGVSRTLATERAKLVSDVSYRLGFDVPALATEPVSFADTLSFRLQRRRAIHLDFKGTALSDTAIVNGKACRVSVEDGHIRLDAKRLRKGQNTIILRGQSSDEALNRRADHLYTLFVPSHAQTAFPCFDQPDLKAHFTLSLRLPHDWQAISSASNGHPIPTYLFSFAAGRFSSYAEWIDGRELTVLYRETDSAKVAQLPEIARQMAFSLRWLERYTGIKHPFDRFGAVVLPSYQFGGMEHPGAIQLRDRTIFLSPAATEAEELARFKLIAHEVAHLWFGDMVTMQWFDDVWLKEVFANFMASKMGEEVFPSVDHALNFLRSHTLTATTTDRTDGTHPIQQPLANLDQAGLLYGNIIYNKAPVMMAGLERLMGAEAMQRGLGIYLRRFAYANARWADLVAILDSVAPTAGVSRFCQTWVEEKGMPIVSIEAHEGQLTAKQSDPNGKGLFWPQQFAIGIANQQGEMRHLPLRMDAAEASLDVELQPGDIVVPNADGLGYGRFQMAPQDAAALIALWTKTDLWSRTQPAERLAQMATIYENWLMGRVATQTLADVCLRLLPLEGNALVADRLLAFASSAINRLRGEARQASERKMLTIAREAAEPTHSRAMRRQLKRTAYALATTPELRDSVYNCWLSQGDAELSQQDWTSLSYRLALLMPERWEEITQTQLARIENADDREEYARVSQACSPDAATQQRLFEALLSAEGRQPETQAGSLLALLSHRLREPANNSLIAAALDALEDVQQTSSIFFPSRWISSLLAGHTSAEAREIVAQWILAHPDLMPQLMNKLKEESWMLRRIDN